YPGVGCGYNPLTGAAYYTGVATTKNGLGTVCLVFGLGSLWRLLEVPHSGERPRRARPLIAHGAILAMAVWLFYIADSATSLACFLVGGVLIALANQRESALRPAAVYALTAGIAALLLLGLFAESDVAFLETLGRG